MNSQAPIPVFNFKQKLLLFSLGIFRWQIPTYTTNDELIKLYKLSSSFKKDIIAVEIGSYIGASSLLIAKGLNNNSKLFCIDTWQNDAMTEGHWDSYQEFLKNTKKVRSRIETIRATSYDSSQNFQSNIDFLFIDGDHSYESVKIDTDNWFKKLNSGGVIVMHDIGWAEGVQKVINEDIVPFVYRSEQLSNMWWGWKK